MNIKDLPGTPGYSSRGIDHLEMISSGLTEIPEMEKRRLGIQGGVRVQGRLSGMLSPHSNICRGFVITHADHQQISGLQDFVRIVRNKRGVMVEGFYPDGHMDRYYLELKE